MFRFSLYINVKKNVKINSYVHLDIHPFCSVKFSDVTIGDEKISKSRSVLLCK